MTARPEPLQQLLAAAATAKHDTTYQITLRAWHLEQILHYITTLEGERQ